MHLWWAKPVEPPAGVVSAPAPGTLLVEKQKLYVAGGGGTWLRVEELQPADRKRMRAADFINGLHVKSGERFEPAA